MNRINARKPTNNYTNLVLPVIVAVLIVWLVIKAFFWWSDTTVKNNNLWSINIWPNQEKSEIFIYMSWDSKKQIEEVTKMYPTDSKMEVVSGESKITFDWNDDKIYAKKLWELKYEWKTWETENFKILNWDFWVEWNKSFYKFELRNITVSTNGNSVFALSQNTMATSVYVLKWETKITANIATKKENKDINVWVWQKITILNSDLNDANLKLEDKIEPIDDFFKEDDFFIKHNWASYLNTTLNIKEDWTYSSWQTTWTSSLLTGKNSKAIIINYPEDEATLDTNTINIEWKIWNPKVEKVTINDKEASLNKEELSFVLKDFILTNDVNNIVYKAYDSEDTVLIKWVMTIYSTSKEKWKEDAIKPTVTTYPISSKDFRINSPKDNPFKTTDNFVKISWSVNKWAVKFITINDFRLTKFNQFWSDWYYFANKDYWTMNDWINLYTIKYYWTNDELLYTSLFQIIKESPSVIEETTTPKKDTPKTNTWSSNSSTWTSSNG